MSLHESNYVQGVGIQEALWGLCNQLGGYIDEGTPPREALFIFRMAELAEAIAYEFSKFDIDQQAKIRDLINSAALIVEGRSTAVNSKLIQSLTYTSDFLAAHAIAESDLQLGLKIRSLIHESVKC